MSISSLMLNYLIWKNGFVSYSMLIIVTSSNSFM
ncbi:hypothetical protein C7379_11252 [Hallella colorans]|uniref:Uncharacterized protein n=1 Tax=Hallella colorans TaxID=1703337 RepID=A0A2U0U740_9BACT|nr:hypothetical protein C7379_11252 [Hallella colorans]